ncbi:SAM_1 domain-containing protein [Cephalotus follicularis]|uniref:SAM_1 domain-containing protein n=1 Tax=Cephalotus follicularis TaxID=3775 RepID=A0A1Q3BU61_CEPFO|nr:SAM_1 domain-containing protein [Cephalotus follicularis]
MAAELLLPPDHPITTDPTTNTNTNTNTTTATGATTKATASILPAQPDNPGPSLAPKRQRRPSVRLGEIGDQPAATLSHESHVRRNKHPHHWYRLPKDHQSKSIKARSLTHLVNGSDSHDNQPEYNLDDNNNSNNALDFGHHQRRIKSKRATTKRVRSNWAPLVDEGAKSDSREDNGDEGFRDFDPDSDSPFKDPSPVHSFDNMAPLDSWHRRPGRARVSDNDGVEMDNLPESDSRDRKCEGVRTWLIELGLSRYAPVFEIHEVDEEVLPMLTLEDLKDMGINAVGSRRKLYTAIQKLHKGFS